MRSSQPFHMSRVLSQRRGTQELQRQVEQLQQELAASSEQQLGIKDSATLHCDSLQVFTLTLVPNQSALLFACRGHVVVGKRSFQYVPFYDGLHAAVLWSVRLCFMPATYTNQFS